MARDHAPLSTTGLTSLVEGGDCTPKRPYFELDGGKVVLTGLSCFSFSLKCVRSQTGSTNELVCVVITRGGLGGEVWLEGWKRVMGEKEDLCNTFYNKA